MRFGRVPAPFILFYCQVKPQRWRDRRRAHNQTPNGHRREQRGGTCGKNWRNRLIRMVARDRIELPTRGFSGQCPKTRKSLESLLTLPPECPIFLGDTGT
jgi:hypothetical protein